jgi:4-hydroxy-2-oxoheptanedioate aldolase
MIETKTALDNIDVIMATPGIDAAFLGPSDLSIALTDGKVLDPHSKAVEAGIDRIAEAARKAKKIAAAYCATPERALELQQRGFRFFAIASDLAFLRAGTAAALKKLKP